MLILSALKQRILIYHSSSSSEKGLVYLNIRYQYHLLMLERNSRDAMLRTNNIQYNDEILFCGSDSEQFLWNFSSAGPSSLIFMKTY